MTDERLTDPVEEAPNSGGASGDAPAAVADPALADLQRERDDFYDRLLRKSAEFDNYRKRVERERREQADQAVVDLLRELLLVVDDFDIALTVSGDEGGAYRKGVELIHAKLHDMLRKQGVKAMDVI